MGTLETKWVKELAIRYMEAKTVSQRDSLYEFLKYYREKEKKAVLDENRHIKLICEKLEQVYTWEIKRLIINIPPRSLKTEIVSKTFPVRCLWHDPRMKFMEISYSSELAEKNSWWARDMYLSDTYLSVFPRRSQLKDDQNTKQHRETERGGQMYASGSTWTITGVGADCIIIDDPMKPNDANSDIVRVWVNNNYHDTLESRLNNKTQGSIVIIMQRLHDDDLCWHLLDMKKQWIGDDREELIVPAIAEVSDEYRKVGESFFHTRFPLEILHKMKSSNPVVFSTQYQQNPVNKDTQEFHEERFRYYNDEQKPKNLRIFTTVDPAFSKKDSADYSCIITWWFDWMDMYILEYTVWRYNPAELIDKIIYHNNKRSPEKIWIESFQAQTIIWFNLKAELSKRWQYVDIEEIRQTGDKESKLRKLIPLYRNWHIYHRIGMDELEFQLKRFPKGRNDDIIDAEQMLYSMYELVPNNRAYKDEIQIKYDNQWRPIIIWFWDDYDI